MRKEVYRTLGLFPVIVLWAGLQLAQAAEITVTNAHTPFEGSPLCKTNPCSPEECAPDPACDEPCGRQYIYQAFDVSQDLAFNGGDAQNAVASGTIDGNTCHGCPFSLIHRPEFVNDGCYGNGSSWVAASSNSWVKIDLDRDVLISGVMFGRERVVTNEGPFDDRDPGQFIIAVALTENVYENGDETNDVNEYVEIVNSSNLGFCGVINGPETIEVSFEPVLARYVKLTFSNSGVAIDEVEIMMAQQLSCLGFEAPFGVPLELKKRVNRTIPLKIQLFDGDTPITDADVASPVVNVYFTPESGSGQDLTDELEPLGAANEGNAFRYDADCGCWVYNLGTKQFSTDGKYTVTVAPGDESYAINPTCEQYFIRLP